MKRILLIALIFSSAIVCAQKKFTINGYVEDQNSKERLIGVNVYLKGTQFGTTTNTYGFYSLTVPEGEYTLISSFIGYDNQAFQVSISKDTIIDFSISESSEQLQEVEVVAEELSAEKVEMSTVTLSAQDIKNIPALLGEVDIIKALQLLPGVQSGGEGTTGFYVRGGSPDQNLILLDGVPVYNASHLFGFFSVFNADAIKNVKLTKGGFPARHGGRLSSVLEIDLKEGNMKEFHGDGSIGLISSKLTLEGPIVKDKTSFMISGRRTYYDLVTAPIIKAQTDGESSGGYYFYDVNAKVNHIFSRKDRLYVSYYGGNDKFYARNKYDSQDYSLSGSSYSYESEDESALKWGNHTGSIRWNHLYSDKLFGNLTATYTQYRFSIGYNDYYKNTEPDGTISEKTSGFEYYSFIRDYGLRYDMDYAISANHSLRFGANYTYHIFKPGVAQIQEESSDLKIDSILNLSKPIFANDMYAYVEDDWRINNRWRANYGLHYSYYFTNEANYHSLQPRLSMRYLIDDTWAIKGSFATMTQYIHLLSNSGLGLPTDLWVSSTDKVKPQQSQQVALGTTKNINGKMYELSFETYYKTMQNLIEYKEGAGFISTTDWEQNVETDGKGEAYGFEFLLRKNQGKTTGWVGYTLAWTNRQFSNLNEGKTYPYKYDRRHDLSIVVNHKFNDKIDVGATWVYGSGNTFTAPIANYYLGEGIGSVFYNTNEYTRYSDRNALRMPAYHRLDLGVNFRKQKKWGERIWNVSVYNVYNRKNPYYLYIPSTAQGQKKTVKQVSLFPIIPSVSYVFSF